MHGGKIPIKRREYILLNNFFVRSGLATHIKPSPAKVNFSPFPNQTLELMKKILMTLVILSPLIAPLQAAVIFGGDFQMYKPGTDYTVTAELSGPTPFDSYASGFGDGLTLKGPTASANYSDSNIGNTVDLPGWKSVHGGNPDSGKNGVDGSTGLNIFAAWGGQARVETVSAVGTVAAGNTYTISAMIDGPAGGPIDGPLAFHLLANGVQLTPSAIVDVPLPGGNGFQTISRTYDASSIAGHIGESLTIIVGVEDTNTLGNRMIWDNVSLDVVAAPSSGNFSLIITPTKGSPGNYDFKWNSQDGKLYDLVSSTDLSTAPSTWAVYLGNENIMGTGPINTLTNLSGTGPVRFFVVIEKDSPP